MPLTGRMSPHSPHCRNRATRPGCRPPYSRPETGAADPPRPAAASPCNPVRAALIPPRPPPVRAAPVCARGPSSPTRRTVVPYRRPAPGTRATAPRRPAPGGPDPGRQMNTTSDRHQASPPTAFLRSRGAATLLLLLAAIAGLAWANSPWGDSYEHFWETPVGLDIGGTAFSLTLHQWVNDGLMVLFFLAIGLELSRELTLGELRERRVVVVPVCAAVGGVVGPALIYLAFNAGGPGAMGWGIPVGTDTAFALGLISVIGARCPAPLRVFLLTLSIADDILAIAVIALFYTTDLSLPALGAS